MLPHFPIRMLSVPHLLGTLTWCAATANSIVLLRLTVIVLLHVAAAPIYLHLLRRMATRSVSEGRPPSPA